MNDLQSQQSQQQDYGMKKAPTTHLPVSLTLEHVSPVTRLLEKRKQMLQVQESLDAQKIEYQRAEDLFKRREENLRKKDLELQEALVLFNKFLKENESKRRRADHRANDEIKKRLKWERQIVFHKSNVMQLREKCEKLKLSVAKNEKYQKYLDRVQDTYATHFDEISSIITRYSTLKSTNSEMIRLQELLIEKNEKLRLDFSSYKKEQYNWTLELNNEIASRSQKLEEAIKRTSEVEEERRREEQEESEEQRISTQIILATDNLFHRCRRVLSGIRRHGSQRLNLKVKAGTGTTPLDARTILRDETIWKLNEIETYLLDFQDIILDNEKNEKMEQQAQQASLLQQSQIDANRRIHAKLRQVRENHLQYERERLERIERGELNQGGSGGASGMQSTANYGGMDSTMSSARQQQQQQMMRGSVIMKSGGNGSGGNNTTNSSIRDHHSQQQQYHQPHPYPSSSHHSSSHHQQPHSGQHSSLDLNTSAHQSSSAHSREYSQSSSVVHNK